MGWKKFAIDYLSFSRRDRIAVITLLVLILGVYFLPQFIGHGQPGPVSVDTTITIALARLEIAEDKTTSDEAGYKRPASHSYQKARGQLFNFDPNTIGASEWKRLGLRDKTIGTIQNYLNKGGKFRKPEDLKRVYGLFPDEYERLEPFIKIGNRSAERGNEEDVGTRPALKQEERGNRIFKIENVEINEADTSDFIALPGIGSKLALRIINFREKLGGFYSVEQVRETFGLADSTFQKIKQYLKLGNTPIKKININTITLDELKAHPYIRYAMAGPIIAYRNEHGMFKKIEDLKNVMAVTDEVFKKIENYLTIQ